MAKLCAVDLRPDRFQNGSIAQTSVAKLNSVIIRQDIGNTLCVYLLCDATYVDISGIVYLMPWMNFPASGWH